MSENTAESVDSIFQEKYQYALKSQTHLWIATSAHYADSILDMIENKTEEAPVFNSASLAVLPSIGCYVCETPYNPRLRLRKCKGEPKN